MDFDPAQLQESVVETWSCLFGMEATELDTVIPHGVRKNYLSSIIQITGDWVGSVIIDYAPGLARQMASMFSDCAPELVTFPQMRDVLGETVNIVAGHIKEHLPPGCHLSLPAVVAGLDYRLLVTGAQPAARRAFTCDDESFQLTIFELDPDHTSPTGGEGIGRPAMGGFGGIGGGIR